jgi:hypothetical protein
VGPDEGLSNLFECVFTTDGCCVNSSCGRIELCDYANATPAAIAAVPAPPALPLASTAVAGLGFASRLKAAQ